jgi:hypothetical protein
MKTNKPEDAVPVERAERSRREPQLEPDLARAVQRMYPTLARVALSVCRLHRLRPPRAANPPAPLKHP